MSSSHTAAPQMTTHHAGSWEASRSTMWGTRRPQTSVWTPSRNQPPYLLVLSHSPLETSNFALYQASPRLCVFSLHFRKSKAHFSKLKGTSNRNCRVILHKEAGQEENMTDNNSVLLLFILLNNKSAKCAKDLQENPVKTYTLKSIQKLSENNT